MARRLAVAALLLAGFGASCAPPPAASAAAATVGATSSVAWRTLGTWSGRGNRQTESFDVVTGALRLTWEALDAPAASGGHLKVSLHSAISGRPLQTIVDQAGAGASSATLVDDPRPSYLSVDSAGVTWRLTLEESVPSAPGGSARR